MPGGNYDSELADGLFEDLDMQLGTPKQVRCPFCGESRIRWERDSEESNGGDSA